MAKVSEPFSPKISLVILPTVCHTNLMMLVRRIWYSVFSIQSFMGVNGLSYQQLLEKKRAILTDIAEEKRVLRQIFGVLL